MNDSTLSEEEYNFLLEHIESPENLKIQFSKLGLIYNNNENIINKQGFQYLENILHRLEEKDYLKKTETNYNIFCPKCNFPNVYSLYTCPTCYTSHLQQVTIIQHPFCGFTGPKSDFHKENTLKCPGCNTTINNQTTDPEASDIHSYKIIGFHFECDKKHRFNRPEISHLCPNCQAKFNFRESNYRAIHNYTFTEKAYKLLHKDTQIEPILEKIKNSLTQHGFSTTINDKIAGYSSSTHHFSLTGKKNNTVILFEVSKQGTNDELTMLLGKKMDIENSIAIFIDTIGKNELESLGQVYRINIVNIKNEKWLTKLENWLTEFFMSQKISVGIEGR